MKTIQEFLNALSLVAASPFAFVAYIGLLILWGFYLYQRWHTKRFLKTIKGMSEENIWKIIRVKTPDFAPREGFSAQEYLRYVTLRSLTAAFFVSALVVVIIIANSTYRFQVKSKIEILRIERDASLQTLRRVLRITRLGLRDAEQKSYKTAAALLQEAVDEYPSYETYMNLGYILEELSEIERAKMAYRNASDIAPGDPRPLNSLGVILLYEDPVAARVPLLKALDIWQQGDGKNKELLLMIKGNLGCAFFDQANAMVSPTHEEKDNLLLESYRYYTEALELTGYTKDREFIARIRSNLGNICTAREQHEEADVHFQVALAIKRELAANVSLAITENNYGKLLLNTGSSVQARKHFLEARKVFAMAGHKANEVIVLVNLSDVSISEGRFDEAEHLLGQALEMAIASGVTTYVPKIREKLALAEELKMTRSNSQEPNENQLR